MATIEPVDIEQLRADLLAEQDALDSHVSTVDNALFAAPSPSAGWTVSDQIGHLAYFDHAASVAILDPATFREMASALMEVGADGEATDDLTLGRYRAMTPDELVAAWRQSRSALASASETLDDSDRIAWYGPSMGAKSFLTARLMECWAHGRDIGQAVGFEVPATDRLHHIARLGFATRGWSYANRGLEIPQAEVTVVLEPPGGGNPWTYGDIDNDERVEGPALDFCLVVTQRAAVDETELVATPLGRQWLEIAQAFAGPPTDAPRPGARDGGAP